MSNKTEKGLIAAIAVVALVGFGALCMNTFATDVALTSSDIDPQIPRKDFYSTVIAQHALVRDDLTSATSEAVVERATITATATPTLQTVALTVTLTPQTASFTLDGTNYVAWTNCTASVVGGGAVCTNLTIVVALANAGTVVTNVF